MRRILFVAVVACLSVARGGSAQEIQRGTIAKLDVEKKQISVTVDGRERSFQLREETRVFGADGGTLAERLKGFKTGSPIFFKPTADGDALEGIKSADGSEQGGRPSGQRIMSDTSALKPLTELGTEAYRGSPGGLYPDGQNTRPAAHEQAGLKLAAQVRPLDADGKPADDGRIVLLSIGMSNTSQASQGFQAAMREAQGLNPRVVFVNGAVGGMTAQAIADPFDGGRGTQYWMTVDERLAQAGVTRKQVQAVWIKQADAGPNQGFPDYAKKLQGELASIVRTIHDFYPNVKLCYLSSRTYGGYATTPLNPEPYAYESGFSVKWLIEEQIKGDAALNYDPSKGPVKAPWLSWGPYLWANGETKRRADGFSYAVGDFVGDGTHPSPSGQRKVGGLLLDFFSRDTTTKSWFLK